MSRSEGRFARKTAALDEFQLEAQVAARHGLGRDALRQSPDSAADPDIPLTIPPVVDAPWMFISRCIQLGSLAYEERPDALARAVADLGMSVASGNSQYHTSHAVFAAGRQVVFDGAAHAAVLGNKLYISFQGTEPSDLGDLTNDLLFALLSPIPGDPQSLIVEGYARKFLGWVNEIVQRYSGYDVVFTGHSLGGMVAETFTHWGLTGQVAGLNANNTFGVAFGSPGVANSWAQAPSEHFFHISRFEDHVGMFANGEHIGPSLFIEDLSIGPDLFPGIGPGHSHWRYAEQLEEISDSSLASYISFARPLLFMNDDVGTDITIGADAGETLYGAVFGGEASDIIRTALSTSFLADGEDGNDFIYGGSNDDILAGGRGRDELYGGSGRDRLYGGDENDTLGGGDQDDVIYGGGGDDTAVFRGPRSNYDIYFEGPTGAVVVKAVDSAGLDRLYSVEYLQFGDQSGSTTHYLTVTPPPTTPPPLTPPPTTPPSPPPPIPGDDYGNTRGTAAQTTAGSSFFGAIETLRDQDWFSINLVEGGVYGFAMSGAAVNGRSALGAPHLYLYDENGDLLANGSTSSITSLLSYTARSTGTYYLQARANGDATTGAYVISSSRNGTAPSPDDDDDDDEPAGPVRLDLDAVEDRVQEDDGSLIYRIEYRGELTEDIEIAWELRGAGDDPIEAADVSRMSGTVTIREVEDDGYVTIRINPTEDHIDEGDEEFELTIRVVSGNATITDNDAWGTIVNDDDGNIHPDIDEHSNSFFGATQIIENTWNRGFITTAGDVDFFAVYLTAGATYRLTVAGNDDNRLDESDLTDYIQLDDPQAALYDSNFSLITGAFETPINQSTARHDITVQSSGIYYIAVREDGDDDIGQYFIKADVRIEADDFAASISTTASLIDGQLLVGSNERPGDDDWFKVTLEAGQTYSFFAPDEGVMYRNEYVWPGWIDENQLRLLNASGQLVAEAAGGNSGPTNQLTFTATQSGDYFLSVRTPTSTGTFGNGRYVVGFDSVAPPPSVQPIVYQPGASAGTDVSFASTRVGQGDLSATDNGVLRVGGPTSASAGAGLRFDLGTLPLEAGAAYLDLYFSGTETGGGNGAPWSMILETPSVALTEALSFPDLGTYFFQNWLSAPTGPGWYRIEITSLYNAWQDGSVANNGLLLLAADLSTSTNLFYSSDHIDAALRPRLIVHERSPEEIRGTSGHETVVGTTRADILRGLAGDDLISGDRGADVLDGGAGADFMNGGDGFDTATYASSAAAVQVNLEFNEATGGEAEGDSLVNIENLIGSSFADVLIGNHDANDLQGGSGDDRLLGGLGNDILTGGLGNDFVDGGSGQDILTVSGLASSYRLLMNGDAFILKGPEGGDHLTGVESIRFSDGRVLELNRMYGPDVDTRAWADGRIPEELLSGGAWSGERPLVLPGPAGDDFLTAKDGAQPEVLPEADDGDRGFWKDADTPLVLPGADDVVIAGTKGFGGPEVLPGVDDSFVLTGKTDLPPVLPPMDEVESRTEMEQARELMMALARENWLNRFDDNLTLLDDGFGIAAPSRGDIWQ
jgi:Ca2+-binding RTX toxin-like protein